MPNFTIAGYLLLKYCLPCDTSVQIMDIKSYFRCHIYVNPNFPDQCVEKKWLGWLYGGNWDNASPFDWCGEPKRPYLWQSKLSYLWPEIFLSLRPDLAFFLCKNLCGGPWCLGSFTGEITSSSEVRFTIHLEEDSAKGLQWEGGPLPSNRRKPGNAQLK